MYYYPYNLKNIMAYFILFNYSPTIHQLLLPLTMVMTIYISTMRLIGQTSLFLGNQSNFSYVNLISIIAKCCGANINSL
jgi:hypothetical protein